MNLLYSHLCDGTLEVGDPESAQAFPGRLALS
jgi:hypothetical protein